MLAYYNERKKTRGCKTNYFNTFPKMRNLRVTSRCQKDYQLRSFHFREGPPVLVIIAGWLEQ